MTEQDSLLKEALEILEWLDEEGDSNGRCHMCKSAPCLERCRIYRCLKKAGLKS